VTDRHRLSCCSALALVLVCGLAAGRPAWAEGAVTQERLTNPGGEPGNWLSHHRDYAAHRFSTLGQINRANVKDLKVAWTMALGGVEGGGI
jgi:alcohol dehydrogenase (cytochrome c)